MPKLNGLFHVASWESKFLIKVEGYATLNNSLLFKDFVEEMSRRGYEEFIIDLSACKGMDSTFMGVLTGILNMRDSDGPSIVTLVNINSYHQRVLDSLGISSILTIKKVPIPLPAVEMKTLKEDRYHPEKRIKMIQEAHEALMAINERNKELFGEFLELLNQEVKGERQ